MLSLIIVFYFVIPAICLIGVEKKPISALLIEKDTAIELRGLSMLLIILAHAVGTDSNYATFFFYVSAILGVGMCFLLSGYGKIPVS